MKRRIVLVDDVEVNLQILESLVRPLPDVETFTFTSSCNALDAAPGIAPDLFVVDYRMPAPNGLEMLAEIRTHETLRDVPVVIVTAENDRKVCYDALDHGASDFLVRPIDPREFTQRVGNLLALEEARKRVVSLLANETNLAELHAHRLEMLWRIGSNQSLDDAEFLHALLDESGPVIRAGHDFKGALFHLDGAELVLDAAQRRVGDEMSNLSAGWRISANDLLLGNVLRGEQTQSWPDITKDPRFADKRVLRARTCRAFIATRFSVGVTIYAIGFLSDAPLEEPFSSLDHAFVEMLASFCATRLHQRAQSDRFRYQSEHDGLTGVRNRASFRAEGLRAIREGGSHAVVVVDLDRFRTINDTLGHQAGDALLVEVGAMLAARAGPDCVARLGGDEFGIVLHDVHGHVDAAARIARYIEGFAEPFGLGDRDGSRRIRLNASFGVALAPEDGRDFEVLLARADAAVFSAKEAGRGRLSFFDQKVEDGFAAARMLENDLAAGLGRNELVMYFQPHVEVATGRIAGAEALIRWNHPERGLLPPSEFVPFAESHGMMGPIGAWVMQETARLSAAWRKADAGFHAWFNLSASELADPTLVQRLHEIEGDIAGLGVEITETAAMDDIPRTLTALAELRTAGFAVALDDFGTGYSSLAHLKRLPLDLVKIDRAFVAGVPGNAQDEAIVEAIIEIGSRFGFAIVAEGVEIEEQLSFLRGAGCAFAQGYLIARPMPAVEFGAWLTAQRAGLAHF